MKVAGIYMIQSISKPERVYIGSSLYMRLRKSQHLYGLRNNKHSNRKLQNHYNKYGESDLIFSILTICSKDELKSENNIVWLEQFFIDAYHPWFNIAGIAGSTAGIIWPAESKIAFSKKKKGCTPWNKGKKLAPQSESIINSRVERNKKPILQYDKNMCLVKEWLSIIDASLFLSVDPSGIIKALKGKRNSAGGFVWRYKVKGEEVKIQLDEVFIPIRKTNKKRPPMSQEQINEMSRTRKGQHLSPLTEFKPGFIPWNKNIPHTEKHKQHLKEAWAHKRELKIA